MQDKQKVTLYLPPGLHRQIKIRAAVDAESMSNLVERAIAFYLENPEVVDELEATQGKTHQVYACPQCKTPTVVRDGEMVPLGNQLGVRSDELPVEKVREKVSSRADSEEEEKLVPSLIG